MPTTMEEVAGWLREAAGKINKYGPSHILPNEAPPKEYIDKKIAVGLFLDRAAQVEAMGWRLISEAPRNERVLLWAEGWYAPNTGEWAKTGFSPDGYCEWAHQPTHYRPNVQPPATP